MGVKNQLLSYYYFRQALRSRKEGESVKARQMLARMRLAKGKGYSFMLDSGAFTYQMKSNQGGSGLPPAQTYFEEYYAFVAEYHDLFDIIVEFDVDGLKAADGKTISLDWVDDHTNRLLDLPGAGPKIMPVFHRVRGQKWIQDWLVEMGSPYIGLSSGSVADDLGWTMKTIALCHRFGKFVHGFGQTRIKTDIKHTRFDSVDSTTWLRADKYGGTCIFMNGKFIVLDHLHKADRAKYKTYWESWGLDFGKVKKDDLETMRMGTIIAWRELALYMESKQKEVPYLYKAMISGNWPLAEHPLITRKRMELAHGKAE
jgi:hypothetical protein